MSAPERRSDGGPVSCPGAAAWDGRRRAAPAKFRPLPPHRHVQMLITPASRAGGAIGRRLEQPARRSAVVLPPLRPSQTIKIITSCLILPLPTEA
ncbi:hypothetical protein AAFF_G00280260 [Aldrovandia affinis]|uniref:Uncharacterized protein n=1 Tax=Aldrovandia affinis TaxID=143900 RepID=A0AAD7R9Y9_9TELE|nr:hypothetical protein AAFF_G00280260 [Aldrovandia affinis]